MVLLFLSATKRPTFIIISDVFRNRNERNGKIKPGIQKLKGNSVFFKPRPYFWHEIRLSTHREQFGEGRRPLRAI